VHRSPRPLACLPLACLPLACLPLAAAPGCSDAAPIRPEPLALAPVVPVAIDSFQCNVALPLLREASAAARGHGLFQGGS